jgi:hypothetical protein
MAIAYPAFAGQRLFATAHSDTSLRHLIYDGLRFFTGGKYENEPLFRNRKVRRRLPWMQTKES